MVEVFSKEWFRLHQEKLIKFANSHLGRFVFKVNKKKHLKGKIFTEIYPNALVWKIGEKDGRAEYGADIQRGNAYAEILYRSFKPVWFTLHFMDWVSEKAGHPKLQVDFGFHTLLLRSEAGENYPSDGTVFREADPEESFVTIKAGNGNDTLQESPAGEMILGYLEGFDYDPDLYYLLGRGQMAFSLAMLFQGCEVTNSYLDAYTTYAVYEETESTTPGYTDIVLVNANMADNSKMSNSDYENMGSTHLSDDDITESNYTKNSWHRWNLNAAGISMLESNFGGTAEFGTRLKYDVDGPQGGKPDLDVTNFLGITAFRCICADNVGTTGDPFLFITYTKPIPTLEENIYTEDLHVRNQFLEIPGESIGLNHGTIDTRAPLEEDIPGEAVNISDSTTVPSLLQSIQQSISVVDAFGGSQDIIHFIDDTVSAFDEKVETTIQSIVETATIVDSIDLSRTQNNPESMSIGDTTDTESFFGLNLSESISVLGEVYGVDSIFRNTTGISPVWILKMGFATETIYLSDYIFTCDSLDGGVTTLPWIKDWTSIFEDISGKIGEVKISDFNVKIIFDRDYTNNIHELLWNSNEDVESVSCELYLWATELVGSDAPPNKRWSGTIYDYAQTDEQIYSVQMIDHSVRFNSRVGNLVGIDEYPQIDPDDVGKMAPIIYGSVKESPALAINAGAVTTLAGDLTDTRTYMDITDATYFPANGVVQIEGEHIAYSGISGHQLTGCTRGYNSTTATTHAIGIQLGLVQSEYWYLLADHPVKSIDEVYVDGVRQTGSDFTSYPNHNGKAKVKFTTRPILEKSVDIEVDDNIAVRDYTVSHNDGVTHNATTNALQNASVVYDHGTVNSGTIVTIARYDNHPGFTYNTEQHSIQISFTVFGGGTDVNLFARRNKQESGGCFTCGDWVKIAQFSPGPQFFYYPNIVQNFSNDSGGTTYIQIKVEGGNASSIQTQNVNRNCIGGASVSGTGTSSKQDAIKSKTIISKDYYVAIVGNSSADTVIGTSITADIQGYNDDNGIITGISDSLIERPDHVVKHFLNTYADISLSDFYTDTAEFFEARDYKFAAVLDKRKYISTWLKAFAWQSKSYFKYSAGKPQLLWRSDNPVSSLDIDDNSIRSENNRKKVVGPKPSPMTELLNVFDIQYDRDWTKEGDGAYRGLLKEPVTPESDRSVIRYGQKSNTELSTFDFVVEDVMAQDLLTFYRDKYKDRKKVFEVEVLLNLFDLAFGDIVTLVQDESTLCEIQAVNTFPGSSIAKRMDKVKVKLKEV